MRSYLLVACLVTLPFTVNAALISQTNGTVLDTDQNIYWLADTALAHQETFGVSGISSSGRMDWYTANLWIDGMNTAEYLGFSDWRLPNTLINDPDCTQDIEGNVPGTTAAGSGYHCTGSEFGHLFYEEIGATAGNEILSGNPEELDKFGNYTGFSLMLTPRILVRYRVYD